MIMPKVIKTAEDYNLALNRINDLMNAKPETPEFDFLVVDSKKMTRGSARVLFTIVLIKNTSPAAGILKKRA